MQLRVVPWRGNLFVIAVAVLMAPGFLSCTARAQDQGAEASAVAFLRALDSDDPAEVYAEHLGPYFKSSMSQGVFVDQWGMTRIQFGGPASVLLRVGCQAFSQDPQTGRKSEFHYCRFRAVYPNGPIFHDVYLEKIEGVWKIVGFWYRPAPA